MQPSLDLKNRMIHKLIHWAVDNALIVLLWPWRSWVSAATHSCT